MQQLFSKVDVDGSGEIDFDELRHMFDLMKINLSVTQARNIYQSIDFDLNGKVSFPEFLADFNKTIKTDINTLLFLEKERYEADKAGQSQGMGTTGGMRGTGMSAADQRLYNSTIASGFGK